MGWSVGWLVGWLVGSPNELILGNDNTSPICSPNGVWAAQAAFAPRVANAKFFVPSDEWDVWQCEPPVSNMKQNKFGTNSEFRDANRTCCSFVPSVQDFMPFECPVNVRRRANNGSAEFPKMKVQGLYVFLVNGTVPTCKACNR